jgi:signal transduction histidine kinase
MSRRRLFLLSLGGIAVGVYNIVIAFIHPYPTGASTLFLALELPVIVAVGWSFIFVGLYASARRPHNRVGTLMTIVGFAWFIPAIGWIPTPLTATIYYVGAPFYLAVLAHIFVAFPSGRLHQRVDRATVAVAYIWVVGASLASAIAFNPTRNCPLCVRNLLFVPGAGHLQDVIQLLLGVGTALVAVLVIGVTVHHWRSASPPGRRIMAPIIWAAAPALADELAYALQIAGVIPSRTSEVVSSIQYLLLAIVPVGFLVGVLRTRLGRAAVGDLAMTLGAPLPPGGLRVALARSLGDPSLQLAFWRSSEKDFVDADGRSIELPALSSHRAVTVIEGDGQPLAALIHDPALDEDPGLVIAAGTVARFAIENERLHAEVKAQLKEVRASRMRIIEAGDAERQRVERNLHDGAQQRLLSLSLSLRMARQRAVGTADQQLLGTLDEAADDLNRALSELRELARGIHPAVLQRSGLDAGIRSLTERSPIPVEIVDCPTIRYPPIVEATAYYVVAEALANAAKHARATQVQVSVLGPSDGLHIEVCDNGVGGADPSKGSGLSGLMDRVASLGGQLRVDSPENGGTKLIADIPAKQLALDR